MIPRSLSHCAGAGTPRRRRSSGAFTLVELLIGLFVFGVVSYLVYNIFEAFMTDTRRLEETDAVFAETRLAYQEMGKIFRVNSLAAADELTSQCVWRADVCAFPILSAGGEGLRIRQITSAAPELSASPKDYPHEIHFQYADGFTGGLTPVWKDQREGTAPPRLIKATLTVRSKKYKDISMTVTGVFDL